VERAPGVDGDSATSTGFSRPQFYQPLIQNEAPASEQEGPSTLFFQEGRGRQTPIPDRQRGPPCQGELAVGGPVRPWRSRRQPTIDTALRNKGRARSGLEDGAGAANAQPVLRSRPNGICGLKNEERRPNPVARPMLFGELRAQRLPEEARRGETGSAPTAESAKAHSTAPRSRTVPEQDKTASTTPRKWTNPPTSEVTRSGALGVTAGRFPCSLPYHPTPHSPPGRTARCGLDPSPAQLARLCLPVDRR